MNTANKNLVGVVVRNVEGKLTHIVSYGKAGYRLASGTKQVPMTSLIRKGRILVELDPERLKAIPKDQSILVDGHLHIHSAAAYRAIKKGETVDVPPSFENWSRYKGKAVAKVKPVKPALKKATSGEVKVNGEAKTKKVAAKKPVAIGTTSARVSASKTVKQKTPKSDAVDRTKETQRTLFIVMQHARTNKRSFKEFESVLSKAMAVTPGDLPPSAREIVAKFGAAKVRKGLDALAAHFHRIDAEQSMPRHLKKFIADGTLTLSKVQLRAVVEAIAPTIPEYSIPYVLERYFGANITMRLTRTDTMAPKPPAQTKTDVAKADQPRKARKTSH